MRFELPAEKRKETSNEQRLELFLRSLGAEPALLDTRKPFSNLNGHGRFVRVTAN